jgi:hypothetical protein
LVATKFFLKDLIAAALSKKLLTTEGRSQKNFSTPLAATRFFFINSLMTASLA